MPSQRTTDLEPTIFASPTLARHLARGVAGFGLIVAALALASLSGGLSLLLAPLGLLSLRGCPMCWTLGLIETLSAGRVRRDCSDEGCRPSRRR